MGRLSVIGDDIEDMYEEKRSEIENNNIKDNDIKEENDDDDDNGDDNDNANYLWETNYVRVWKPKNSNDYHIPGLWRQNDTIYFIWQEHTKYEFTQLFRILPQTDNNTVTTPTPGNHTMS